jgi:CIC family chloride channel protein
VLLVLACKLLATWLTAGSGAVGGIFTPTLFVGAALGYLFALAVHAVAPGTAAPPAAYAMVGMGAMLAAASSAPLMAILMIFEMTLSYQVMLPLMLCCVVAYFVARTVAGASKYDITVRRAAEELARVRLRETRMQELVRPAQTVLPLQAPLAQASALFEQFPVKYLYLVDDRQRYHGVLALRDLAAALLDTDGAGRPCASLVLPEQLPVLTPDMTLDEALLAFMQHHGERLPTVRGKDDPELLGVVYKTDLLDAYVRLNREPAGARIEG